MTSKDDEKGSQNTPCENLADIVINAKILIWIQKDFSLNLTEMLTQRQCHSLQKKSQLTKTTAFKMNTVNVLQTKQNNSY